MTVSNDVRAKDYNGAQSASSALKIEKVETLTNIKVHGPLAAVGTDTNGQGAADKATGQSGDVNADATGDGVEANPKVVDLKLGSKALKDLGVELTSEPTPQQTQQITPHDAPLKAVQAATNGPSYKLLIMAAAALVVVIAGLFVWSGASGPQEVVAAVPAAVAPVVEQPVVAAQTATEAAAPVESVSENEFVAQITAGTIAALRAGKTVPAEPAVAANDAKLAAATLFSMVLEATAKDLSMPEIDHMLNVAYTDGTIKVPAPFLLSSGRVNTSAIMTAFVGQ